MSTSQPFSVANTLQHATVGSKSVPEWCDEAYVTVNQLIYCLLQQLPQIK